MHLENTDIEEQPELGKKNRSLAVQPNGEPFRNAFMLREYNGVSCSINILNYVITMLLSCLIQLIT